jgi:hypothetical protein
MALLPLLISAITTLAGPTLPSSEVERYATDIAEVAGDDVKLAVGLVATADEEGFHFSPRIERCECKKWECDRDPKSGKPRSFTIYQLQKYVYQPYTPEEICADNRIATELAAKYLRFLRKQNGGSMRAAVRWFNGADADDPRIVRRLKVYDRWVQNAARLAS